MSLLAAEALKLRTTRVSWVLLAIVLLLSAAAAAGVVGISGLDDHRALDLARTANLSATFATIVGILLVTNEYRHGTITSTFLTEPRRLRVALTKLAAALSAGAVFGLAAAAATAAVAVPWLAARGDALALDGQLLEALARLVVSFALSAALGAAVGAIVQNQVGAIVATFVWFLVLEPLVAVLGALAAGDIGEQSAISKYLPGAALDAIVGGIGGEAGLRAGPAALLAAAYVFALGGLGALSMLRRDP